MITTSKKPLTSLSSSSPPSVTDETLKDDLPQDDIEPIKEIKTPNGIRTSKPKTSQPVVTSLETPNEPRPLQRSSSSPLHLTFSYIRKWNPKGCKNGLNRLWVTVTTVGVDLMRRQRSKNSF
ncbi:hypothetical protein V6N13_042717 [Hibiscus sabdariffa]|uniref:Uncharacterized protein n=1 Tax=Hibiscus sabdariffa TaxID=183260 RepID=A0ABR2G4E1_9ROSI